ncbi:MAG: hypothetical protein NT062_17320 [Proteobacteria bacterium]|nr:hypothetical protein [Pseudomonadota bacterium]
MKAGVDPKAPTWTRKLRARLEAFVHHDLEEVVLQRGLGGERYATRTTLTVVEADLAKVQEFCDLHHVTRADRAQMTSYFDNHYHGLFAVVDGALVGHVWWFDDRISAADAHPHLSRLQLALAPGDVWGFDLYLAPAHRGGGASNDFFVLFRQHLDRAGYKRVYGHVDARKLPAVWLHKLQGYTSLKTVKSRVLFDRVLVTDGRVYVKNPSWVVKQKFDFHRVV